MMDAAELSSWPHVYRPGLDARRDAPVLLMLHGTGGNEREILSLADAIDPEAAVLAPRGRVSEHGATRWFRRIAEGQFDVDDVNVKAAELAEFVAWARQEYGLAPGMDARPIIAVGFSNGANIALALAVLHPETVTLAMAFSGMYPLGNRELPLPLPDSRVLLLNGEADPMAPSSSVDQLETELLRAGAGVERVARSGGHGITAEEIEKAQAWLATAAS
ncbi:alpha/beta hydrolase [Subtercola frigoramans]|uniref:Phospholipase/carboxylesterase n=1 Tax=Subtercola frigoramans TaxID=120298 RepID=A0ABS2L7N0_9MICO|nr:alpha/beta hydrolase [Subtercola frigoramans]MBM7473087.1 phospholipase/carboxylesterase [Subtercola frigoramans]